MSAPATTSPQVVKVSLVDQVADIVRDRVANGELAPGRDAAHRAARARARRLPHAGA